MSAFNLDELKRSGYKLSAIVHLDKGGQLSLDSNPCILCGDTDKAGIRGCQVDEKRKQIIAYSVCSACLESHEFRPESADQFFKNIVEPRLEQLQSMPHLKASKILQEDGPSAGK
jgi:hypothetical protein